MIKSDKDNDNFVVMYSNDSSFSHKCIPLNENTYSIEYDNSNKLITTSLFYTRDVMRLNQLLKIGNNLYLKHKLLNKNNRVGKTIFDGNVEISNVIVNTSIKDGNRPYVKLFFKF